MWSIFCSRDLGRCSEMSMAIYRLTSLCCVLYKNDILYPLDMIKSVTVLEGECSLSSCGICLVVAIRVNQSDLQPCLTVICYRTQDSKLIEEKLKLSLRLHYAHSFLFGRSDQIYIDPVVCGEIFHDWTMLFHFQTLEACLMWTEGSLCVPGLPESGQNIGRIYQLYESLLFQKFVCCL